MIGVIIPARNEEKTIGKVIEGVKEVLDFSVYKIIVVNDGSTDKTAEIAQGESCEVVNFKQSRGLANVYKAGLKKVLEFEDVEYVVSLDADGQHNPKDIPKLLGGLEHADLVVGSRFLPQSVAPMSKDKKIGNKMFTKFINLTMSCNLTDTQSGFRAYTREVAEKLKIRSGFSYAQQMILQTVYHKFKVVEVPIKAEKRQEGESRLVKSPLQFAFQAMNLFIWIFAAYYPLKFFWSLGMLFLFLGAVVQYLAVPGVSEGLFYLGGMILFLFGMQFKVMQGEV